VQLPARSIFPRLPSLKRCNTRGNFPFHYPKYKPRIYVDNLPPGYVLLDYSLGKRIYNTLYKYCRRGTIEGIIYKDKMVNKWRYAVKLEDIKPRRIGMKDRCQDALLRIKDLDSQSYFTLTSAARLIGFDKNTLKAHYLDMNLLLEIPAPIDYKDFGLDNRTRFIVTVEELRLWLTFMGSSEIRSTALPRNKDPRSRSSEAKQLSQRKCYQRYQDHRQLAIGSYGGWRKPPNHSPESKARRAKTKSKPKDVDNL
jgi:hypothetical protein